MNKETEEKKVYLVSIQKVESETIHNFRISVTNKQIKEINYPSAASILDITKSEYDYELLRGQRLDNKISILLVVSGVLFGYIFKFIPILDYFSDNTGKVINCFEYFIASLSSFVVLLYGYLLSSLVSLLKPSNVERIDTDDFFNSKRGLLKLDIFQYACSGKYLEHTGKNQEVNQMRTDKYELNIDVMKILLISCLACEFFIHLFSRR